MQAYTFEDFNRQYPDEEACLQAMLKARYGKLKKCPVCNKPSKLYPVTGRKAWVYSCGHQVNPLGGTIFAKSRTPLRSWFLVVYLMATSRNGVSAKEVERHLDVTYKTAWRMCKQIRSAMITPSTEEVGVSFRKNFLDSVEGTYHLISEKYFQHYLWEFLFRHANRKSTIPPILFQRVMEPLDD